MLTKAIGENIGLVVMALFFVLEIILVRIWPRLFRYDPEVVIGVCGLGAIICMVVALIY